MTTRQTTKDLSITTLKRILSAQSDNPHAVARNKLPDELIQEIVKELKKSEEPELRIKLINDIIELIQNDCNNLFNTMDSMYNVLITDINNNIAHDDKVTKKAYENDKKNLESLFKKYEELKKKTKKLRPPKKLVSDNTKKLFKINIRKF